MAHSLAFLECAVRCYFWPPAPGFGRLLLDLGLVLGLGLIVVGQATRTVAMAQAGSNFNHLVQSKRKQGHVLVTSGIYAWLRHPSYFGFWWWGLGTQLVLGNVVCLVGYAAVLWRFFRKRIEGKSTFGLGVAFLDTQELIVSTCSGGRAACGFLWERIFAVSRTNSSRHTIHPLILTYRIPMDCQLH